MATVNIKSVNKYYDNQQVLNNINLHIEKGEFIAIVGPSGCGKSTLLRLVAGLDTVSDGTILINNQCVNEIPPAARDMAMVFQSYALYPHMTAFDNMAYGLKIRGMNKVEIGRRVRDVANLLKLNDYLEKKPSALSGGQRQRVAMGRAMVRSPSVFLFDEPLSNLDAKLRTEMRYEIKKLHQQFRTTCLYVTHDQTEAMTLADKIVVLNKGNVEQIGTPSELYQYPASSFVASFLGHYSMNLLPATIDLNQSSITLSTGAVLPLPSLKNPCLEGAVLVGIRPEHMKLACATKSNAAVLNTHIEFIDDMGADKLVQVKSICGNLKCSIRILNEIALTDNYLAVEIDTRKMHLFCQKTGKQLRKWNE
jgi:ABC-type sugar transport system ATPase subunit